MMKFMLITNDPVMAAYAESCGVGRIFVDLEQMGKQERQGHRDTLISRHSMKDVAMVKEELVASQLLVRLNPLHDNTKQEVDDAIDAGADLLMLPMFYTSQDVRFFCDMVDGRAGIIPLVETYAAAQVIGEIVHVQGVTEIYIGLNDLHMDMQLKFMFEPLANGFVDKLVQTIKSADLPFGFGGIARTGEGAVPGELVLGEHVRLGSSSVILSRTFHSKSEDVSEFKANLNLKYEIEKLLLFEADLKLRNNSQVLSDQRRFQCAVKNIVEKYNDKACV